MGSRERSWAFAVAVITALVGFRLGSSAYPLPGVSSDPRLDPGYVLTVVVLAATGLLILHEQPRHPVGWMLMLSGLCFAASATLGVYGVRTVADATVAWPLGVPALAVAGALWLPGVSICFSLLPQRYPDGELVGPRWRVLWWVSLAAAACVPVVLAFSPGAIDDWVDGLRPFEPPSWVGPIAVALVVFDFLGTLVGLFSGLVGLFVRFRRGTVLQRRQTAWLVVPLVMIPLATFVLPGGRDHTDHDGPHRIAGRGGRPALRHARPAGDAAPTAGLAAADPARGAADRGRDDVGGPGVLGSGRWRAPGVDHHRRAPWWTGWPPAIPAARRHWSRHWRPRCAPRAWR